MTGPVAFVSHFRVKEGMLEGGTRYLEEGSRMLEADKPRTAAFLPFLSEDGAELSIVHVFADADAMDAHVEGADERSREAYEYLEPTGWEVYGRPSGSVVQMLRAGAERAGVPFTHHAEIVGGFLRLVSG